MMSAVMLPWFPIILAAAVGARLVERQRATWLGVSCALYFILVVQLSSGTPFWQDPALASAMLAGAASIAGMAEWSGRRGGTAARRDAAPRDETESERIRSVSDAIDQFDQWLQANRSSIDAWAGFDEFVRRILNEHLDATHVRPFRILTDGAGMIPLCAPHPADRDDVRSPRKGILWHVATSGRSYHADDPAHGPLVDKLAQSTERSPDWCFAVRHASRTVGIVSVGGFAAGKPPRDALQLWERIVAQFWLTVTEVHQGRSAATTDAVSRLLNQSTFIEEAELAAEHAHEQGEPVALCVIVVEGLRSLTDGGLWGPAREIVAELSVVLRERVRPDDILGQFDDGRFVVFLRRVDSDLATLIASQLTDRLQALPVLRGAPHCGVEIRCGIAGSGTARPDVSAMLSSAVRLARETHGTDVRVNSDIRTADDESPGAVGTAESRS